MQASLEWAFESKDVEFEFVAILATRLMNNKTSALIKQAIKLGYFDAPFAVHYKHLIRTLVFAYERDQFTQEYIRGQLSDEENEVLDHAIRTTPNVFAFNKYFTDKLTSFALYKIMNKMVDLYEVSVQTGKSVSSEQLQKIFAEYADVMSASSSFDEFSFINNPVAVNVPDKEKALTDFKLRAGVQFYADSIPSLAEDIKKFSYPSCGLTLIDGLMSGNGLEPDRLVLYLGLPGHGKSIMLLQAALNNYKKGLNVAFFTFENTIKETMQRIMAHVTNISKNNIFKSPLTYENAYKRVKEFFTASNGSLIIEEYPPASMTPSQVFDKVRMLEDKHKLKFDLVVIDYLDLLASPSRYTEYRHSLHAIYNQTKSLAKTYLIPVITASQLNRAALREKRIDADNVSESFAKIAVVDLAIIIRNNTQYSGNMVDMYISKSRITVDRLSVRGYMRKDIFKFIEQELVYENASDDLLEDIEVEDK